MRSPAATRGRPRPAQTFSYGFIVPGNQRDLDVSMSLASDANHIVDAVLIDPNGELADVGSNLAFDSNGDLEHRARRRSCSTATR